MPVKARRVPSSIEQQAEDARRHLNVTQRGMVAGRLPVGKPGSTQSDTLSTRELAALFDISIATVKAARTVINRGTAKEIATADAGKLPLTIVAREIGQSIPPEERTQETKERRVPRRQGHMATLVYARIAQEREGDRSYKNRVRRRRTAVVEPTVEPPIIELEPIPLLAEPITVPIVPQEISLFDTVMQLIRIAQETLPDDAALELGRSVNPDIVKAYSTLVMWMVEVGGQLEMLYE